MESEKTEQIGNTDPFLRAEIGSFAERITEVIGNESVRSFAERIGLSEGAVRAFLKGRIPRSDDALAISRVSGCSLDWLISGSGSRNGDKPAQSEYVSCDFDEEFALIPGYHLQVSTGHGAAWTGEQVKRHLAFRRKWLKYRNLDPNRLAVVFAKGDSMEPTIHNGDSILIDTSNNQIIDGSIFVLRLGDDLYAKRLQKNIDGGITVISDNRAEYPLQVVTPDQMDNLAVIGKVVWVGHDFH